MNSTRVILGFKYRYENAAILLPVQRWGQEVAIKGLIFSRIPLNLSVAKQSRAASKAQETEG